MNKTGNDSGPKTRITRAAHARGQKADADRRNFAGEDPVARWHAARPFALLGAAAVIAGGLVAAGSAHHPQPLLVWMSAYLVLIVGAAQIVFGTGQAWLSARRPSTGRLAGEWLVFNLGNAMVIAGTLRGNFTVVFAGTVLFAIGILLFLLTTRGCSHAGWRLGYRILLALIFLSSLAGLALSAVTAGH